MKIFIFGSNGMLGNYVQSYLSKSYEIICFTRKDYDLNNLCIDSLINLLKNLQKDDIIINNSPTKLEVPGNPQLANAKNKKNQL